MNWLIRLTVTCMVALPTVAGAAVRSTEPKDDELTTIKTALGIATIVQLPDAIQSAIIGDQSAFKVEYLDRAVTIKPLRMGAKTNLYLFTGHRRYSLRLLTLNQDAADYIVYLKDRSPVPSITRRPFDKTAVAGETALKVLKLGSTQDGFLIIEGQISSKEELTIKPEQIWITQSQAPRVLHSLFLSDITAKKGTPIQFGIAIAKSDLVSHAPLSIELRGEHTLSIEIPEVSLWK